LWLVDEDSRGWIFCCTITATKKKVKAKGRVETATWKDELLRYAGTQSTQSASVGGIRRFYHQYMSKKD
jgi:hypothetical protein